MTIGFSMQSNKPARRSAEHVRPISDGQNNAMEGPITAPAVVVTGGSEGIGRALAQVFLSKGHSVVLVARNAERLAHAAAVLRSSLSEGKRLEIFTADVTGESSYESLSQHLRASGLHIEVLINNAGLGLGGPFANQSSDDLDQLIALNMAALTRWVRQAVGEMLDRGQGHIINMASLGGYSPGPNQAAYYASKAYVLSLSEALASEMAGTGVRIAVVAPGPVDTGFHAMMGADRSFYRFLLPSLSPERVARSVYRGYKFKSRVIIPGVINRLMSIFMRVLPHPILVPLVGWLLAPRGRS